MSWIHSHDHYLMPEQPHTTYVSRGCVKPMAPFLFTIHITL